MNPSWMPRWGAGARRRPDGEGRAPDPGPRVRVLSRAGCHLCEDALAVVAQVCADRGEPYDVGDVDADPTLLSRYGDRVPVVFVDGAEFAVWRVDPGRLDRALRRPRPPAR